MKCTLRPNVHNDNFLLHRTVVLNQLGVHREGLRGYTYCTLLNLFYIDSGVHHFRGPWNFFNLKGSTDQKKLGTPVLEGRLYRAYVAYPNRRLDKDVSRLNLINLFSVQAQMESRKIGETFTTL